MDGRRSASDGYVVVHVRAVRRAKRTRRGEVVLYAVRVLRVITRVYALKLEFMCSGVVR